MAEQNNYSHRKTKSSSVPSLELKSIGNNLKVAITGFLKSEQIYLQHYLKNLDFDVQNNLSFDGQLLISNTVQTNKYIAACFLNIPIVSQQWVLKTYKLGELQPYDLFKLGVFFKLKIGLLGFQENEVDLVREKIISLQGECYQILSKQVKIDVLVIKAGKEFLFHKDLLQLNCDKNIKIVNSEWIRQCIKRNYCVPTNNYEIQEKQWKLIEKEEFYKSLQEAGINTILEEQPLNNSKYNYFTDVVVFIGLKEERLVKLIQRFILLADGIFLSEMLPLVTHAIYFPNEISKDFLDSFPSVKLVNPKWISDSFLYRRKMIEDDYLVSPEQKVGLNNYNENENEQFEKNRDQFLLGEQQQEQTSTFGQHNLTRQSSYGISTDQLFKQFQQPQTYKRALSFSTSSLFKEFFFYIFEHISLDKEIFRLIKNEAGIIQKIKFSFTELNLKTISHQNIIFLLPDSTQTKKMIEQLQQHFKINEDNKRIYYLSYRCINYFLDQKKVDLSLLQKLLYLLPVNFETPSMTNCLLYISVKNLDDKILLRALAKILTGYENQKFDIDNITHFITNKKNGKKKEIVEKINQNGRKDNKILIKDTRWLIDNYLMV